MGVKTAADLLPSVRLFVLREAALGHKTVSLGSVTYSIEGVGLSPRPSRASKIGHRGWIQKCLSLLAKEQLMWERQRPECSVLYEPHDKYFRIRITQAQAQKRLAKYHG